MDNQFREDVGFAPLAFAAFLVALLTLISMIYFVDYATGPSGLRPEILLATARWFALVVFGVCAFVFLLRRALDGVPKPYDE
jgi:hypothetical protein